MVYPSGLSVPGEYLSTSLGFREPKGPVECWISQITGINLLI